MLSRHTSEKGQDLVEFAMVLPLLLLLLLGIMEFGVVIFNYNTLSNAAREGARVGVRPLATEGEIEAAARQLTNGLNQAVLDVDVERTTTHVQVTVSYDAQLMTGPIIQIVGAPGAISLQATSTMRRE